MDLTIVRILFRNCMDAAKLLKRDVEFQNELQDKVEKLLPYQVGKRGQLQEWPEDFEERDPQQRHISHLYPLFPDNQITGRTPELLSAAKRSLEIRGDEGTGSSRAWKICLWARLEDGNHSYKLVIAVNNIALVRKFATLAMGISPLDQILAQEDVQAGTLVRVLPQWNFNPVPVFALMPARMLPAKARVFVEFLATRMKSLA